MARSRGIRLVTTDPSDDPNASWVAIDDRRAGRLVGQHLAGLGHREVVAVVATRSGAAGTPACPAERHQVQTYDYVARIRGLRETIPGTVTVLTGGHNATESGVSAANHLVDAGMLPTAVVGLSDVLALGVLAGLTARGIAVPRDVSVCGFDDIPAARAAELSTVQQPIRRRGQLVGQLLIDPAAQPRQVVLPISLLARATTAGPAPEPEHAD